MFRYIEGDIRNLGRKPDSSWSPLSLGPDGQLRVVVEDSTNDTVSGTQLSTLAVNNSTDYSVTVSWDDLSFDTVLVNNDPTSIHLNSSDHSRIHVATTSIYELAYFFSVKTSGATRETQARAFLNGTTEIPGSFSSISTHQDEVHTLSKVFTTSLTKDDYITFQVRGVSVPTSILEGYYAHVIEYTPSKGDTGEQGPPGAPGAGSTINVYDDSVLVASGIENLNFSDNINVTTVSGSTTADVSVDLSLLTDSYIDIYDNVGGTTITSSWVDLTFDTNRLISSAFSHTAGTTTIVSNTDGNYVVLCRVTLDVSSGNSRTETEARLLLDTGSGFNVVPGSYIRMYNRTSNAGATSGDISCILALHQGDVIKAQARIVNGSSNIVTLAGGSSVTVFSIRGQKGQDGLDGSPGPPGSGSTILLQDEGSYVNNTPHSILNFKGLPVTVSDAGGGIADIDINFNTIFGSAFSTVSDDSTSSTTSTTYQQKLRMATSSLVASAVYRIGWYYEWQYRSSTHDIRVRGQVNDATTFFEQQEEPQDIGVDQWHVGSGFYYYTASTSAPINIDIDYSSTSNNQSSIRKTRIEFWRVS